MKTITITYLTKTKKLKYSKDFKVKNGADLEMRRLLYKSDDKWIKYDFVNGIKELLNRRFGYKLKIKLNDSRDICSDFVSRYACNLDIVTQEFKDKSIVFPEDYIRYLNNDNANVVK